MTSSHLGLVVRPRYRTVVLLASGATFLSLLDATIVNLAITDLHHSFPSASVTGFTWVISLYAILFASFLAPAGRLADVLGRRTLYTAGVGFFAAMSLLCALAPTLPVLLVARALQGVGAAAMIPASLAVVLVDSPPERRARAIGIWSASASAAAAVGPSLGGILIELFSWRSAFLINVPIGIALLVGIRVVPQSSTRRGALPDLPGTALLAVGVGLLTLGVTEGPEWHWGGFRVLGCLVGGVVLLLSAVVRSWRHAVPAIETRLWRSRPFALANVTSLLFGATLYAWMLVAALVLVNVWGYSWLRAGLALSPGAVASAIVAATVGRIMGRVGLRFVVFTGAAALAGAGTWMILGLTSSPAYLSLYLPAAVLAGVGTGSISTGISGAAALSVRPAQFAGAIGLNTAVRQIGGALGVATLAAILPAQTTSDPTPYTRVILFCVLVVAAAGAVGLGLSLAAKAATSAPREVTPAVSTAGNET